MIVLIVLNFPAAGGLLSRTLTGTHAGRSRRLACALPTRALTSVTTVHDPKQLPHVLIADDHFDTRVILRHYFEAMGFRVTEAANGEEALDAMRADRPDALVLDIQMPRLDGIGVLRALRADAALADLKVLALSAHAMVGEVREITLAGVDRYLAKPADPRDVLEAICDLIGRESGVGGFAARPRPTR